MGSAGQGQNPVVREKARLRAELKQRRDEAPLAYIEDADGRIAQAVCASTAFQELGFVLTYLSFGREVDTVAIIECALKAGKAVALPRVLGADAMAWYRVHSLDGLERSAFGMLEPPAEEEALVDEGALDASAAVALVPGLAFDAQGYRLGYGEGYYDRFLSGFCQRGGRALGLCRACALQPEPLPREAFDVPVDAVVTEEGIRVCGRWVEC